MFTFLFCKMYANWCFFKWDSTSSVKNASYVLMWVINWKFHGDICICNQISSSTFRLVLPQSFTVLASLLPLLVYSLVVSFSNAILMFFSLLWETTDRQACKWISVLSGYMIMCTPQTTQRVLWFCLRPWWFHLKSQSDAPHNSRSASVGENRSMLGYSGQRPAGSVRCQQTYTVFTICNFDCESKYLLPLFSLWVSYCAKLTTDKLIVVPVNNTKKNTFASYFFKTTHTQ